MKLATLGYLPPPEWGCSVAFKANLNRFPTRYPLMLYSEHNYGPEVVKLKMSPEILKGAVFGTGPHVGRPNPFAISNLLFLTAISIAKANAVDYFIYLEADCRVGRERWDEVMFEEFFSQPGASIAGGSLVSYNPANYSPEALRRWQKLIARNSKRNFPVPTYGWLGAAQKASCCVFPNGALGIYSAAWMDKLFAPGNTALQATVGSAYDMRLGEMLWEKFKEDAYDVVCFLDSAFSSYGDVLTSEAERLSWLREGRYVAIHQCKSQSL